MSYSITFPDNYVKPVLPMKKEWLEALKSGKYSQGKDVLCQNGNYCCLGVLSQIQGRLGEPSSYGYRSDGGSALYLDDENPIVKLYPKFRRGGFPDGVLVNHNLGASVALSGLNDLGVPFTEIAEIIDQIWD